MADTGQERTEKATGKRRQEARQRGQVAISREIPSTLVLATALFVFYFAGDRLCDRLIELLRSLFTDLNAGRVTTVADAHRLLIEMLTRIALMLLPFLIPFAFAAFIGNVAQIGLEFHSQTLTPRLGILNPVAGAKKFISLRSLVELVKSLAKIAIIGGVAAGVFAGSLAEFPALVRVDLGGLLKFVESAAVRITFYVCLAMMVLAALDYIYQRWQYEESLKMTKQEVKDERKQSEGDPQVKARIRTLQRQTAYRRMMAEVPKSDVVITNPTHLAIALRFNPEEMEAPRVVAKGAEAIAERIKEIAREHGIPLVENKPLAQALFKAADLGDEVPVELYRAVAEVLAYVYRLKGRHAV
jgi:flagellar biosynthetic protein FlhB